MGDFPSFSANSYVETPIIKYEYSLIAVTCINIYFYHHSFSIHI